MSENKMFCSADEYMYLEKMHKEFTEKLARFRKLKPGNAFADSAPKIEHLVKLFAEALDTFEVCPGSECTGRITISPEFQENFKKLKTSQMEFTGFIFN